MSVQPNTSCLLCSETRLKTLGKRSISCLARSLKALSAERTVLVVTHSRVLLQAADGVIALRSDGRIRAAGPAQEVLSKLSAASVKQP